jgi:purine-binding chemotaxis protein CheW
MFKITQETQTNELVGFKINDEYYCFNISWVQEIISIPPISKIPNVPHYIEGSINLRGKIIRIINLRRWLRLPWKKIDLKSKIVVLDVNSKLFGVLIEEIHEVFKIEENQKYEIPYLLLRQPEMKYIQSIIFQDNEVFLELIPETIQNT